MKTTNNDKMTYKDSQNSMLAHVADHPYSKKDMTHPRTTNWHACFGTHSAMGCDGCEFWLSCMKSTFPDGYRREDKGTHFVGAVIIEEEDDEV